MNSKIKAQRYIDSIEFSNECYAEMREVARRAYIAGREDALKETRQPVPYKPGLQTVGLIEMPSTRIKDISVEAFMDKQGWRNEKYTFEHLGDWKFFTIKLFELRKMFTIFAGAELSSKRIAADLRELGYEVYQSGGYIKVDYWVGEEQPMALTEGDKDDLPF